MTLDRHSQNAVTDMKAALSAEPIPHIDLFAAHRKKRRIRLVAASAGLAILVAVALSADVAELLTPADSSGSSVPPAQIEPSGVTPTTTTSALDGPEVLLRSGVPISLFDPPATFPEGTAFHIVHGYGSQGASDTSVSGMSAYRFELYVDDVLVFGAREAILDGDTWKMIQWVSDFPDGLDVGVHTLRGVWLSPDSPNLSKEHSIYFVE